MIGIRQTIEKKELDLESVELELQPVSGTYWVPVVLGATCLSRIAFHNMERIGSVGAEANGEQVNHGKQWCI